MALDQQTRITVVLVCNELEVPSPACAVIVLVSSVLVLLAAVGKRMRIMN